MKILIDPFEVLRYLGIREENNPPELMREIEVLGEEVLSLSSFSQVFDEFGLDQTENGILLQGTNLILRGKDIKSHLLGCNRALLMAATLGSDIDAKLRLYQRIDMKKAVIFDACATSAIESFCDCLEEKFRREKALQGLFLTSRFSPGYGDLPIEHQGIFCDVLNTAKRAGIALLPSYLLTPTKSVTAIMGVSASKVTSSRKPCEKIDCEYRKNGVCNGYGCKKISS